MRGVATNVGENRPQLPSDESTFRRRLQDLRPSKESRSKFVFKERGQMAEQKSAAQSKMAAASLRNPDARIILPRKVERTKNASAVDALRSTRIPGPRKQGRLPPRVAAAAKTESDGRGQNEVVSHSTASLRNKGTKSVKAKSVSLLADVNAGCRIPQPTRNRASFGWNPIGEINALQPQSKAVSKSELQLKADLIASKLRQGERGHQASASGKDGSNSSTFAVLQSSNHRQSAQHRRLENSSTSPSVDLLLPDGATGIPLTTAGPSRELVVREVGSLEGLSVPGKRVSSQNNTTKTCSLSKSPPVSVIAEPCIEINWWTTVKQTEPKETSSSQNTTATTLAGRALREVNSPNHDNWQTVESHSERMNNTICSSYCLAPNDDEQNFSGFSMTPNWNFLELDLGNDSFSETPEDSSRSYVIHKTSDNGRKDRVGNERHTNANDTSDVHTKGAQENIKFAASNKTSQIRATTNNTKNKLVVVGAKAVRSSQSVLSTLSDFINKRQTNSQSGSVGINDKSDIVASTSNVQVKGTSKKYSAIKTKEPSKEGLPSEKRSCPYSSQSTTKPSQLPHVVKKQELIRKTLPSKITPCQESDQNLNELSYQSMPDQITSPKGSKTLASHKPLQKFLQPKAVNTSTLQQQRREEENETKEIETKGNEIETLPLETQTRDEKDFRKTASDNRSRKEAGTKLSKSIVSYKEANVKTPVSKTENHRRTDFTELPVRSKSRESTKSLSPKRSHKKSDTEKNIASENLCLKEAKPRKVTHANKSPGETELKKVKPENKSHRGAEPRKVTFENKIYRITDSSAGETSEDHSPCRGEDHSPCRGTESQTDSDQHGREKGSESPKSALKKQNRRETLSEESTSEDVVEKDFEIVVLKSQSRQKKTPLKEKPKSKDPNKETLSPKCPARRGQTPVSGTSPTKTTNLTSLLAALNADKSGREVVLTTTKLNAASQSGCPFKGKAAGTASQSGCPFKGKAAGTASQSGCPFKGKAAGTASQSGCPFKGKAAGTANQSGCPFKGLGKAAGSDAKSSSNTNLVVQGTKVPLQAMDSSIKDLKQGLEFKAQLDSMEEELEALFKALDEGGNLLTHSSTDYDSDTSFQSSSSPSPLPPSPPPPLMLPSAAVSSPNFVPLESRGRSAVKDEWTRRSPRCSSARFYKFLPVLSPTQNLLCRIPQNKRDPSEWLRAQTALDAHREATRHQPKRTTSETSYFSPASKTPVDDPRGDSLDAATVAATPCTRYPKISDVRFNEGPNLDLCSVNAADTPNFWATLFVEMPTRTNMTVYNIKIELACCALRAFFDPCDRIKFAYVRSVREKLMELIQDGLARPRFEEFVCCERYDCVVVLSLDAGALLRHPKTSFIYSLSAVLEVEPNRVLVLVSTDS